MIRLPGRVCVAGDRLADETAALQTKPSCAGWTPRSWQPHGAKGTRYLAGEGRLRL